MTSAVLIPGPPGIRPGRDLHQDVADFARFETGRLLHPRATRPKSGRTLRLRDDDRLVAEVTKAVALKCRRGIWADWPDSTKETLVAIARRAAREALTSDLSQERREG